jgi:hypothetical protein
VCALNMLLYVCILVQCYLLYFCSRQTGYHWFLPTRQGTFPNSSVEIHDVVLATSNRTELDVAFHRLTNESVVYAFVNILPNSYDKEHLLKLCVSARVNDLITQEKRLHNRVRPKQLLQSLNTLESTIANTPSFPARHAFHAWLVCFKLSKEFPEKETELHALAQRCDDVRVVAGLHFPSDGKYAKELASLKFNILV